MIHIHWELNIQWVYSDVVLCWCQNFTCQSTLVLISKLEVWFDLMVKYMNDLIGIYRSQQTITVAQSFELAIWIDVFIWFYGEVNKPRFTIRMHKHICKLQMNRPCYHNLMHCFCTKLRYICITKPMVNLRAVSRTPQPVVSIIHRWIQTSVYDQYSRKT